MAIFILQMTAPVLLTFLLGYLIKKKQIITNDGIQGLKSLVSDITLPIVLFNAFLTAEYSKTIFITFLTLFLACSLGLALAFPLRKVINPYGKYFPFLMTNFEGGMLGYALFSLLYPEKSSEFALIDIGQTFCGFTVFLSTLKAVNGEQTSLKSITKMMLTNSGFIAIVLGILLGLCGIGKLALSTSIGAIFINVINFIAAPTSAIILIIVGYELHFSAKLLVPVIKTIILRLVIMVILLFISYFVIFTFVDYSKSLFVALMLAFSLPAPFAIPIFMKGSPLDSEYVSTCLSLQTLLTIVLFVAIANFSIMA